MKYKKILLLLIIPGVLMGCAALAISKAQKGPNLTIERLAYLPNEVSETSGLASFGNYLWTVNDSGGKNSVYAFNESDYTFKKRIKIADSKNTDWESLAQTHTHLFIADCGNNYGKRKTLNIYKVSWNKLLEANDKDKVASTKISFQYADYTKQGKNHNFDCEAVTLVDEKLWLFTKNRGDSQSRLYMLDTSEAQQTLTTTITLPVSGLITGADYNHKTNKLALIGYQKERLFGHSFIWIIDVKAGLPVWESAKYHKISPYGQWEALVWQSDNTLLLSAEKNPLGKQQFGLIGIEGSGSLNHK